MSPEKFMASPTIDPMPKSGARAPASGAHGTEPKRFRITSFQAFENHFAFVLKRIFSDDFFARAEE